MSTLVARCPAKINLALHVAGRRADGYHEIVTIFQTIDVWDVLRAEAADELSLAVSNSTVDPGEGNLVMRAARLLAERAGAGRGGGARLTLAKSIPVGGGLGGGSSDAAGALLALNTMWGLKLPPSELSELAAELGSDVPFFLSGGTALGTGRGERIEPLAPIAPRTVVLGTPPFGMATPEVYRALGRPLTAGKADVTVPRLFVKLAEGNDFALAANDLEAAVFRMHAELRSFRDAVRDLGAESALVSGSGSTVFGLFVGEVDGASIAGSMSARFPGWTVTATRTIESAVRIAPAVA